MHEWSWIGYCGFVFFFNDTATTEIYTLSLHDALPIFNSPETMAQLNGDMAIGHVRYSTTGGTILRNIQPLFADFKFGGLAIAHNGNLTNAYKIRQELVQRGCIFQSTCDTETIIHLIAISEYGRVVDRNADALGQVEGAHSLIAKIGRPACRGRA